MKKFSIAFIAVLFAVVTVVPAMAGPSRAIIQEMGSTIGKDEVNVDLDWVPQQLNVTAANDTTVGGGNATIGGIALSSVNVGLADGVELRLGRLPGLRGYLGLPVGSGSTDLGLTLKALFLGSPALPHISAMAPATRKILLGTRLNQAARHLVSHIPGPVRL